MGHLWVLVFMVSFIRFVIRPIIRLIIGHTTRHFLYIGTCFTCHLSVMSRDMSIAMHFSLISHVSFNHLRFFLTSPKKGGLPVCSAIHYKW